MTEFEYIRNLSNYYQPRTPAAAYRAVSLHLLPVEAFVYSAGNITPLLEEPFDLDEIERVLAREDLDLPMYILLLSIFRQLIVNGDPETALFSAESINTIENRYNKKIETLKNSVQKEADEEKTRKLALLYYELSLVNSDNTSISRFYLKESFSRYREIETLSGLKTEDIVSMARILLALELPEQARSIIRKANNSRRDTRLLLMEGEVEFSVGNIHKLSSILNELLDFKNHLDEQTLQIISFWKGG